VTGTTPDGTTDRPGGGASRTGSTGLGPADRSGRYWSSPSVGCFVLFLTRSVGLPAQQVGVGAGLVAVLTATPAGMLADRFRYRGMLFLLYLCRPGHRGVRGRP
jgi:hypothetical protein